IVGPRPSSLTLSSLANSSAPAQNSFCSEDVNPGMGTTRLFGHVSDGQPPIRFQLTTGRGPGSRTGDCAKAKGTAAPKIDQTKTESMSHLRRIKIIVGLLVSKCSYERWR